MNGLLVIPNVVFWGILIVSSYYWNEKDGEAWGWTVLTMFAIGTFSLEMSRSTHRIFPLVCRILGCLFACIQVIAFLTWKKTQWISLLNNISSQTMVLTNFTEFWVFGLVGSVLYLFSGLYYLYFLCQKTNTLITSKESRVIINERLTVTRNALHDIVLGWIWIVLSLTFHDVIDDNDDKQWRSLFCSMIMFHIILMLIELLSNKKYVWPTFNGDKPFWQEETRPAILMGVRFLLYCVIYFAFLNRLHQYDNIIINMGFIDHDVWYIVIASGLIAGVDIYDAFIQSPDRSEDPKPVTKNVLGEGVLNF